MALVAGVDSSTQSCKVIVVDADTGEVVRQGSAKHPDATEHHPEVWWSAFLAAAEAAGGLTDVEAVSVGGQQHGSVLLDAAGEVIRPAHLWNDTSSGQAAADLTAELGAAAWAEATGLVLVASFTVTKLRWLADHEPENAARVAAVCLPHDYVTWRLTGAAGLDTLTTDRSEASGTGYYDAVSGAYRRDLLAHALRRDVADVGAIVLPRVVEPSGVAGRLDPSLGWGDAVVGPGCGDNAGAALGLGLGAGDVSVSIGTSGVVAAVSATPVRDQTGLVAGFADATGLFLPLTATINGARIVDATARVLGVDYEEFDRLALAAEPGAGGLVYVPHLDGERTPNLPNATGSLVGMTLANLTRENLARASVEGMLCLLGVGIRAQQAQGVVVERVALIGGGARSKATRALAPAILGVPVDVPTAGEYVARGAARQAAWVLSGAAEPPAWEASGWEHVTADPTPWIQDRYDRVAVQLDGLDA